MHATQWNQVIYTDLRKIAAEPFFWFILVAPILLGWGLHYLLPYLADRFQDINLDYYFPVIVALIILTPPLYYGVVLGLLVLEEKDENVLLAVAVTPIRLRNYLFTRITIYTLISIPLIVIVHEIIDVIAIELWQLVLVAMAVSLNTPLVVLLLAAFCKNQLEGFVIGKGMSPVILLPLAMYFVPGYLHLACGVLPTYWPIIAYYTAIDASGSSVFFTIAIVMSVIVQAVAIAWLYRRFENKLSLA